MSQDQPFASQTCRESEFNMHTSAGFSYCEDNITGSYVPEAQRAHGTGVVVDLAPHAFITVRKAGMKADIQKRFFDRLESFDVGPVMDFTIGMGWFRPPGEFPKCCCNVDFRHAFLLCVQKTHRSSAIASVGDFDMSPRVNTPFSLTIRNNCFLSLPASLYDITHHNT
jgi:hypothetical protein